MARLGPLLALFLVAALPAAAREVRGDPPPYRAADAAAAVVDEKTLLAAERFWPYHVELVDPWQPEGAPAPLPAGLSGVLIRVEESGTTARIDFGREGLYGVPVAKTDLVERANRVRRGELDKVAANFVLAIGTRLVDPEGDRVRPLRFEAVATGHHYFVCAFADPDAASFPALARALSEAGISRDDSMTILFPQGRHPDARVRERLVSLGWRPPYVTGFLSEPYTRTLFDLDTVALPALLLVTREGRLLYHAPWTAEAVKHIAELVAAMPAAPARDAPPGPVR